MGTISTRRRLAAAYAVTLGLLAPLLYGFAGPGCPKGCGQTIGYPGNN